MTGDRLARLLETSAVGEAVREAVALLASRRDQSVALRLDVDALRARVVKLEERAASAQSDVPHERSDDRPRLVALPAAVARLGSPPDEHGRDDDEAPRTATVHALWMAATPATRDPVRQLARADWAKKSPRSSSGTSRPSRSRGWRDHSAPCGTTCWSRACAPAARLSSGFPRRWPGSSPTSSPSERPRSICASSSPSGSPPRSKRPTSHSRWPSLLDDATREGHVDYLPIESGWSYTTAALNCDASLVAIVLTRDDGSQTQLVVHATGLG